jgi:hypothetical protein
MYFADEHTSVCKYLRKHFLLMFSLNIVRYGTPLETLGAAVLTYCDGAAQDKVAFLLSIKIKLY